MSITSNRVLSDQTCSEIGFAAACSLASSLLNRHDFRLLQNYMTPSPFVARRSDAEYKAQRISFKRNVYISPFTIYESPCLLINRLICSFCISTYQSPAHLLQYVTSVLFHVPSSLFFNSDLYNLVVTNFIYTYISKNSRNTCILPALKLPFFSTV